MTPSLTCKLGHINLTFISFSCSKFIFLELRKKSENEEITQFHMNHFFAIEALRLKILSLLILINLKNQLRD